MYPSTAFSKSYFSFLQHHKRGQTFMLLDPTRPWGPASARSRLSLPWGLLLHPFPTRSLQMTLPQHRENRSRRAGQRASDPQARSDPFLTHGFSVISDCESISDSETHSKMAYLESTPFEETVKLCFAG